MIKLQGLTKVYRMGDNEVWALRGIDLTIEEGDFVAIMGPSGSGKSTLTQILGLLDSPSSGSYTLHGREVAQLTEEDLAVLRRDEIGFIFQQFNLLPRLDATENVALPLFYSKKPGGKQWAQELLTKVGLGDRSHHRPKEMSGGQQQRVAIARSLVNNPRLIIADEPTGNLDSVSEEEIMKILEGLNAQGITVLMVTHEDSIAERAKRIIRIRDGKIVSDERRETLKPVQSKQSLPSPALPIGWRDIKEHFVQGKRTLAANKIRTGLSMLGILIGVASVVAMLAIGRGAQESVTNQLSSLGSNMLVLRTGNIRRGGAAITTVTSRMAIADAKMLADSFPEIKSAVPTVNGTATVSYLNNNKSTQILGTLPEYAELRAMTPTLGQFITHDEDLKRARVAVVGTTVVKELFGGKNPVGESIKINKVNFLIKGVLPNKSGGGFRDENDVIVVPLQTAMKRLLGKDSVDSIEIQVKEAGQLDYAESAILEHMFKVKKVPFSQRENTFEMFNMANIQEALTSTSKTMSVLLASIAIISLLVGGIGIMNIMLVSITERTKEIGLRKAVGARPIDILWQFLAESVVISLVGGTIGIGLGISVSFILSQLAQWPTSITWDAISLAFFFSVFVGIVFGVYPARKASHLSPLEALRYE